MGVASNLAVLLSVLLEPIMPETSRTIREQCQLNSSFLIPTNACCFMPEGHKIGKVGNFLEKKEKNVKIKC